MSALLALIVALPLAGGVVAGIAGRRLGDHAGRLGGAAAGTAFVTALVLGVSVIASGPVSLVIAGHHGAARAGLFADRLSVVMLLLVLGVSAVVQLFSSRYLSGDPRQGRLIAAFGVTTSAVCALVCAATLSGLVAAWTLSGLGLLALLAQRRDLEASRLGLRRTATALAIGDLSLLLGAILVWGAVGDLDLRHLRTGALELNQHHLLGLGLGAVLACLVVVAALARSAQIPFQRWLPATLATPTPVSAFLHAGLVNGGGFLLVRLGPVFGLSPVATGAAFMLGSLTALVGTGLMLVRPDVKGALAHSTTGQMGFMVMAAALGVPAAAIFHLIGHGLYKATLFLGGDSVVHNHKRRALVPAPARGGVRWPMPVRIAVALLAPAAALGLALATFASGALVFPGASVLLAFAWVTASGLTWGWLGATPARASLGLLGIGAACMAYAGLVAGADALLAPAVVGVRFAVSPWFGLLPAAAMALCVTAVVRSRELRANLYVWALEAGSVGDRRRESRRHDAPVVGRTSPIRELRPREQVVA